MKKRIIILGATGSIGFNTLDVVRRFHEDFEIVGMTAHTQTELLCKIAQEFDVKNLALSGKVKQIEEISHYGSQGVLDLIHQTEADIVVNGISGAAGLMPSVVTLESDKDLALANKETVVTAGPLISELAKSKNKRIQPVDSEHAAIFQLTRFRPENHLKKIILTSSGGPFRNTDHESMKKATLKDALNHPTWAMGSKISIDSATLANKGLEVIETVHLFGVSPDMIDVLIHPQSLVHSLIKATDGSQYAQISEPDMKVPIMNALLYPEIGNTMFKDLDLTDKVLEFFKPDTQRFPMLKYAYEVLRAEGSYSIAFNAANEVAVEAFISGQIKFMDIPELVSSVLQLDWSQKSLSFAEVLSIDRKVREKSIEILESI